MYEIYEKIIHVDSTDVDRYDRLRPSALLRYFQDLGTEHTLLVGMGREHLVSEFHGCWILTRVWFRLERPILSGEKLRVETWHRGISGIQVYRDFQIYAGEEPVGQAVSAWVVADVESRKMLRPKNIPAIAAAPVPQGAEGPQLKLIKAPEGKQFSYEKTVRYADLDVNGHMNNTKYADVMLDVFTPEELEENYVAEMQLNYSQECRFGETLAVSRYMEGDSCYIDGCDRDGKRRFEAAVQLKKP